MYQGGIVQLALGKNKMNEINVVIETGRSDA
jgi:hypothetical protein